MIDLETMGTAPGSAIVAIGAVAFNGAGLGDEFECAISLEDCQRQGLTLDASTVLWWLKQSDGARSAWNRSGALELRLALSGFRDWLVRVKPQLLWGNAASFDLGLLGAAYARCDMPRPWKYWQEACYRTLKNLRPDVIAAPFAGEKHTALVDAKYQALHCIDLLDEIQPCTLRHEKGA